MIDWRYIGVFFTVMGHRWALAFAANAQGVESRVALYVGIDLLAVTVIMLVARAGEKGPKP